MVAFRKWVILTHRYLGMALSLLLAMWFISGIAMIYARGMPRITPEMRQERQAPLDFSAVKLSTAEALEKSQTDAAGLPTLLMIMGRPAYRFPGITVFADTGEVLGYVGKPEASKIASEFIGRPEADLEYAGRVTAPDQWTITESGLLPMYKFTMQDATELFVSELTAEVALITTRGSRALAWVSAIPHWFYFAPLRLNSSLWRRAVLWTSGVSAVLTLLGLILAFTQYSTKYSGLMRWHYITGVVFGVFCLTFAFSGMLSMEPFFWASGGGTGGGIDSKLTGSGVDVSSFSAIDASKSNELFAGRAVKEVELRQIQGRPFYVVRGPEPQPLLVDAASLKVRREPFSRESVMARVKEGNPDVAISESQLLESYDSYYYPREGARRLPVLRVKFADPDATWFYIDPYLGETAVTVTQRQRLQRWIYNGFHSFDFNFWYYQGAAWQAAMIALNGGGALLSIIGVLLTARRLATKMHKIHKRVTKAL